MPTTDPSGYATDLAAPPTPAVVCRSGMTLGLLLAGLSGCAGLPPPAPVEDSAHAFAMTHGIQAGWSRGSGFEHRVFWQGDLASAPRVHVYLEGDGRPWSGRFRVSADPTGRDPLALRLMARDPNPALYLGRPCYHGQAAAPGCDPARWTSARYGEPVVASLVAALNTWLPPSAGQAITLIGYSGGGVLALLMAERLTQVDEVVTLAANLDVAAWTAWHGYSPLRDSLNPAHRPPLPRRIRQLHLIGARDRQVPPATQQGFFITQPLAEQRVLPGFDHRCCWVEQWPGLLELPDHRYAVCSTMATKIPMIF